MRTFTQNLMAYAVGRRVEYYDQPSIRRIASDAPRAAIACNDFITRRREERRVPHGARGGFGRRGHSLTLTHSP